MRTPSTSATNCGERFSLRSCARQSNPSAQYATSSLQVAEVGALRPRRARRRVRPARALQARTQVVQHVILDRRSRTVRCARRELYDCSARSSARACKLLFVGINPSLRSAEVGHHFARPGNRFYPALHAAGITPRRLAPEEDGELPHYGIGSTNLVARPTRAADELSREELRAGAAELERLVAELQPRLVVVLGLGAYRTAFARPQATWGAQPETIGGRPVWVLPNPSGLNAHYKPADFARLYAEALEAAELEPLLPRPPALEVGGEDELPVDEVPVVDGQDDRGRPLTARACGCRAACARSPVRRRRCTAPTRSRGPPAGGRWTRARS